MSLSGPLKKVLLIFLLTLVAAYICLSPGVSVLGKSFKVPGISIQLGNLSIKRDFNIALGLDLAGGSHLVFQADTSKLPSDKKNDALNSVKDVIERRVNLFGVSEPNVQTSSFGGKDSVIVELPGVKDTKQAVDIIGQTAQLNFAEVIPGTPSASLKITNLTGADLSYAKAGFDSQTGKPIVQLQFTSGGGDKFAQITGANIGKPLAILLDNQMIEAPNVQEKIIGGQAQITGNFTTDSAKKLAIELNAGALPVPVNLVEEQTVGATLGAESIQRSVKAGLVGLVMVLTFMILAYGKLGLVADAALIIYGILTLALYKLIPVVLTLPGIAGFLLSVGMAVDSNILIFERFKEERVRRPLADALEVAFGRAWNSIRDANIATLVTAFVLANPLDWTFLNTSGPIRGFAITLALGIGLSLFTGIIVSRNLLRVFIRK